MRFRKGQKVEFGVQRIRGIVECVKPSHLIVFSEDKIHRWWISRDDSHIRILHVPKTKLNKMINAYCEAEFKQMGISR